MAPDIVIALEKEMRQLMLTSVRTHHHSSILAQFQHTVKTQSECFRAAAKSNPAFGVEALAGLHRGTDRLKAPTPIASIVCQGTVQQPYECFRAVAQSVE